MSDVHVDHYKTPEIQKWPARHPGRIDVQQLESRAGVAFDFAPRSRRSDEALKGELDRLKTKYEDSEPVGGQAKEK
ncbi:hypothetical protein ACFYWY_29070 [Streptomyces sp. NPDC002870]|uniref:hypothetical protein n=1 Tax=Streptomyces sp. NPDC002870 TaxID=3364666 RepID=UPI0036AC7732